MLVETGRVVAVDPDGVWVETIRQSTCGSCAAQQGCGHSLLNRISDGKRSYIRVLSGAQDCEQCRVDDQVRISIPEDVLLRGSLVVYMLPLFCLLLGPVMAVGLLPGDQDMLAALGAVAGFGVGFILVRWHAHRHRHDQSLQPTLLEVLRPLADPVRIA